MQTAIQIGDTRCNVRDQGQGAPLLLVHGFPLDHSMWDAQVAEFSRDHRVIAPDLRGFGGSDLGSQPISMGGLADDLAALLDELRVTEPIVFCGLSMGGYIAWQFWDRHPARLGKLILCDTRAAADSAEAAAGRRESAARVLREGTAGLVEGMVPKLFAEATLRAAPDLVGQVRHVMETTHPQAIAAALLAMAERPNMEPRLAEIAVPTLVLCGQFDAITPAEEMRRMAAAMPSAPFQEVAAAGHMSPLEQPVAVNQAIRQFLGSAS